MGWNIYEKWIDIELYCQMVDLVYRLSTNKDKDYILRNIKSQSLFLKSPQKTMEEEYELHYPGEVLERLEERTELALPQIRALGYALAQTNQLHEDGMFIGTQRSTFQKRWHKGKWQSDCFLLVIHHLMDGKGKKKDYEQLLEYPYKTLEEYLLILSVFAEDETIWDKIKFGLNQCLSQERDFTVPENIEAYAWLCKYLVPRMKGYRKKDLNTLKALAKLPCEYARDASMLRKKFFESGYTLLEILYLNYELIKRVRVNNAIFIESITAERMAVEICMQVLNGEDVYPKAYYILCGDLIQEYRKYQIKIEGAGGILDSLYDKIVPRNIASYQCLYKFKGWLKKSTDWFQINLLDERWYGLHEWLKAEDFEYQVTQCLRNKSYSQKEMTLYLSNYEKLTGKNYTDAFWKDDSYDLTGVFRRLVDLNILNPVELTKAYVQEHTGQTEVENTWQFMIKHLLRYMEGIQSPEAYQMLKILMQMPEDIAKENGFSQKTFLFESFSVRTWTQGRERFDHLDLVRVFLSSEEHIMLFLWLEQVIFQNMPEYYVSFLLSILENINSNLWMPESVAKSLCFRILEWVEDGFTKSKLRKRYMSSEDFETYENQRHEKERRKCLIKEQQELDKIKCQFTKSVAKSRQKGDFRDIRDFLGQHRYGRREDARAMVAAYLGHFWGNSPSLLLPREEIRQLLEMELMLFEKEFLDTKILQKTIMGVEVQVNV